jgi:acyl-coenzyme A thioesterase PaaI-like protein
MPPQNPGERIGSLWSRFSAVPGGAWVFSRLVWFLVPYTATIGANIQELRPGYARVTLRDRRKVRNHLRSIHALALGNLGEMTSGMPAMMALPPGVRSIVTGMSIEYLKKARGTLTAESSPQVPLSVSETTEMVVHCDIRDSAGDVVARTHVHWRLSPPSPGQA